MYIDRLSGNILISIHAPREGSDPFAPAHRLHPAQFQSTLPVRGATDRHDRRRHYIPISIHAPREGSDAGEQVTKTPEQMISIHAPREGSDSIR